MGRKLAVFLGHPRLQGLPAALEVPGKDGHGPNAEEVAKAKKLHRSGVRAATPKSRAAKPKSRGGNTKPKAARAKS
jgi:hypothetical protein